MQGAIVGRVDSSTWLVDGCTAQPTPEVPLQICSWYTEVVESHAIKGGMSWPA